MEDAPAWMGDGLELGVTTGTGTTAGGVLAGQPLTVGAQLVMTVGTVL